WCLEGAKWSHRRVVQGSRRKHAIAHRAPHKTPTGEDCGEARAVTPKHTWTEDEEGAARASMSGTATVFKIAKMSSAIWVMTLIALAVPACLFALSYRGNRFVGEPAFLVTAIYAWVWLRFRPRSFIVAPGVLEIIWPMRRRQIKRSTIT